MHTTDESAHPLHALEAAVLADPDNVSLVMQLSVAYLQHHVPRLAVRLLRETGQRHPKEARLATALGNVLTRCHRYQAALKLYQAVLSQHPQYAFAYHGLGNVYVKRNQLTEAYTAYTQAIACDAHMTDAYFNRARVSLTLHEVEHAKADLQTALTHNPEHLPTQLQLASLAIDADNWTEAETRLNTVLSKTAHPHAEHLLGLCYFKTDRAEKALPLLKSALGKDPDEPDLHLTLATVYLALQDRERALAFYLRHLERTPSLDAHYNVGILLSDKNRDQDALFHFKAALAIDPQHIPTHLNLAALYLKHHQTQEALRHYEAARTLAPERTELNHIIAALTHQPSVAGAALHAAQLFDQYAPQYEAHLCQHLQYRVPDLLHRAITTEMTLPPPWRIADLGCGTGLMGMAFAREASFLWGIDISQGMLKEAEKRGVYHRLTHASLETALLEEPEHTFAIVVAADALPYIGDLTAVYTSAFRALQPGGLFAFTVEKGTHEPYRLEETIRYTHHPNYLQALASQTGFSVIGLENAILRQQAGKSVEGYIVLLQR